MEEKVEGCSRWGRARQRWGRAWDNDEPTRADDFVVGAVALVGVLTSGVFVVLGVAWLAQRIGGWAPVVVAGVFLVGAYRWLGRES